MLYPTTTNFLWPSIKFIVLKVNLQKNQDNFNQIIRFCRKPDKTKNIGNFRNLNCFYLPTKLGCLC